VRVNTFLEAINDRVFGINSTNNKKENSSVSQDESPYWKQVTGKSKKQFLQAAKKERGEFFLLSSFDLSNVDLSRLSEKPSDSKEIRQLTYWDKLRIKFKTIE